MFCKHFANFVNHLNFFVCFFWRLQPVMPETVLRSGFKSCMCQWHAPLAKELLEMCNKTLDWDGMVQSFFF